MIGSGNCKILTKIETYYKVPIQYLPTQLALPSNESLAKNQKIKNLYLNSTLILKNKKNSYIHPIKRYTKH